MDTVTLHGNNYPVHVTRDSIRIHTGPDALRWLADGIAAAYTPSVDVLNYTGAVALHLEMTREQLAVAAMTAFTDAVTATAGVTLDPTGITVDREYGMADTLTQIVDCLNGWLSADRIARDYVTTAWCRLGNYMLDHTTITVPTHTHITGVEYDYNGRYRLSETDDL